MIRSSDFRQILHICPATRILSASYSQSMADQKWQESAVSFEIVWPTREQVERGLAEVERYARVWKSEPALLVIKPLLGLIVSLREISQDDHLFTLTLAVEQALVAQEDFNELEPVSLSCVWNQPYMHLSADVIFAPYSFSLHFGARGVERVVGLSKTKFFRDLKTTGYLPAMMRGCFTSDAELPE